MAGATGRRIVAVPADTTNREAVEQMVKETVANLGRVDILVNNASTPGGLVQGPLAEASDELLMEDVNTKVIGYFRCAKAVEPHMRQQHWGRIINIGGLSGGNRATSVACAMPPLPISPRRSLISSVPKALT